MQFDGKIVVITGGFPELGEATARLFAQRGAAGIVLGGRNVERGHAIAAIMTAAGCTSHFVPADLANLDDCAAVLGAADQAFGRIDVLVNNLGVIDSSTLWETSPEIFDHIFAINVRAPFFFMQGAAAIMRRERIPGTLINIISLSCQKEPPLIPAYHASEGALASMMQSLGLALMNDGISVFGLNIGWPGCEFEPADRAGFAPDWSGRTAHCAITPQEVAQAIALLASADGGVDSGSIVDFNPGSSRECRSHRHGRPWSDWNFANRRLVRSWLAYVRRIEPAPYHSLVRLGEPGAGAVEPLRV